MIGRFGSGMIPTEVWGNMTYFEREMVKERRIRGNLKRASQKDVVGEAKKSRITPGAAVYSSYLAEKVSRLKDLEGALGDGVLMSEGVSLLQEQKGVRDSSVLLKVEIARLQEELGRVEAKRVDVNGRMERYSEAVEQRLREGEVVVVSDGE